MSLKLYKHNLWLAATKGPRDTTYSFPLLKTIMVAAKNCGLRPQFGTGHKYCNFGKCVAWVYCCLEPQHGILWHKAMLLATSLKKIRCLGSQWSLKPRTVQWIFVGFKAITFCLNVRGRRCHLHTTATVVFCAEKFSYVNLSILASSH